MRRTTSYMLPSLYTAATKEELGHLNNAAKEAARAGQFDRLEWYLKMGVSVMVVARDVGASTRIIGPARSAEYAEFLIKQNKGSAHLPNEIAAGFVIAGDVASARKLLSLGASAEIVKCLAQPFLPKLAFVPARNPGLNRTAPAHTKPELAVKGKRVTFFQKAASNSSSSVDSFTLCSE